jgi:hypothetical protein
MCWQALFEMKRLEFVKIVTDLRLKKMGENVPGKGLLAYANNNVLLFDHAGTPILSILITALGKEPTVPGSKRNRIQDVTAKHELKEQDLTETFLKRGYAFGMSDGNEWFKATAWCFGENFAKVVAEREEQKIKQQERRVVKAARGVPKPRAPKTPIGAQIRPKKGQKASDTAVFQSVLPPAGASWTPHHVVHDTATEEDRPLAHVPMNFLCGDIDAQFRAFLKSKQEEHAALAPAAHAAALDLGGNGLAIQAAAYPPVHFHALAGAVLGAV